ncbi:MAG TPA: penicillin-binding protein, partial [Actinomycetales bacterium]|nr:penicillin-binding protein [Actinomycetales bacterium]
MAQRPQPNRRSVRAGVTPQGTGNRSAARPVGRSSGAAANNKSAVKNSKNSKKFKLIDYPRTGKRGIRRWLPSWRQILGLFLAAAALGIGVIFAAYYTTDIPAANDFVTEETTKIYFADGETLMGSFAAQNREIIDTTKLPDHVAHAVVAAEDRSFYENKGIDPAGMARAVKTVFTRGRTTGGSTITQQYVKNYYLTSERTLSRKFTEAILAVKIDQRLEKEEILDSYLNVIYFGRGAYGIETAAQAYFQKDAADLTISEAALLAGIIPSPTNWDPDTNLNKAKERWNYVLDGMVAGGWITQNQRDAQDFPELPDRKVEDRYAGPNGYLLDMVRKEIVERTEWTEEDIDRLGMSIITTIDPDRQEAAVAAVENLPEGHEDNLKVSLVSVDPRTGGIEALYGGPDFIKAPRNAVTQDRMQAASTFKPFTLVAALEKGVPLSTTYPGNSPREIEGFERPVRNFGNIDYGTRDLVGATANSVNTAYAQLNVDIGPEATVEAAVRAGIPEDTPGLEANPANVLGTASPHPLDMVRAYATFAAQGQRPDVHIIAEVYDSDDALAYAPDTDGKHAFDSDVMADLTYALTQVVEQGSGRKAQALNRPVAGKTGSSQENRAAWFAGYVPQLATAVSLYQPGPDGEESITPWGGVNQVTGSTYPTDVWVDFMEQALADTPIEEFPERANVGAPEIVWIEVPDVVGMKQKDAELTISGAGLSVLIRTEESEEVEPGHVISTDPAAGESVREGQSVTLV